MVDEVTRAIELTEWLRDVADPRCGHGLSRDALTEAADLLAAAYQRTSPSTVSDEEVERVASAFPAILVDGDEDYWTTDDCHRRMARAAILAVRGE